MQVDGTVKTRLFYHGYDLDPMVRLSDLRACTNCHMVYYRTPSERCAHCNASGQQEEVKFD